MQIVWYFLLCFVLITANEELKAVFAKAREGKIRVIKVDIQDGKYYVIIIISYYMAMSKKHQNFYLIQEFSWLLFELHWSRQFIFIRNHGILYELTYLFRSCIFIYFNC